MPWRSFYRDAWHAHGTLTEDPQPLSFAKPHLFRMESLAVLINVFCILKMWLRVTKLWKNAQKSFWAISWAKYFFSTTTSTPWTEYCLQKLKTLRMVKHCFLVAFKMLSFRGKKSAFYPINFEFRWLLIVFLRNVFSLAKSWIQRKSYVQTPLQGCRWTAWSLSVSDISKPSNYTKLKASILLFVTTKNTFILSSSCNIFTLQKITKRPNNGQKRIEIKVEILASQLTKPSSIAEIDLTAAPPNFFVSAKLCSYCREPGHFFTIHLENE